MEPKKKIMGAGVCGGGEADRYMEETLKEFKRLTDYQLIVLNHGTEKEKALLTKYGIPFYEDDREWGVFQPRIKEMLLEKMSSFLPDWVLMLDMDERMDRFLTREKLEEYASKDQVAYHTFVVNLWNDGFHYARNMCFWKVQFFKYERPFTYQRKNVHCGLAPAWATNAFYLPHLMIHRGLMRKEDRDRKIVRYEKYDPDAKFMSRHYYEQLKQEFGDEFDEEKLRQEVENEVKNYKSSPKKVMDKPVKYFWVLRKADGVRLDIPEKHLEDTLKQGGFELLGEISAAPAETISPPKVEVNPLECIICGFVGKNMQGLRIHSVKHGKEKSGV